MSSTTFLKIAYVVAWLIYLGYLGRILLGMKRVAAERRELERVSAKSAAPSPSLTR